MITKELIEYVKNQITGGVSKDTINHILINNGWEQKDINEAFDFLKPKAPKTVEPIKSVTPPVVSPVVAEVKPVETKVPAETGFATQVKSPGELASKIEETEFIPSPEIEDSPLLAKNEARYFPNGLLEPKSEIKINVVAGAGEKAEKISSVPADLPIQKPAEIKVAPSDHMTELGMGHFPVAKVFPVAVPIDLPQKEKEIKKHPHVIRSVVAAVLVLGVGALTAYGYFFYWNGPTHIQKEMSAALVDVKSFAFSLKANLQVLSSQTGGAENDQSSTPVSDTFVFQADGAADGHESLKALASLSVTAPVLFDTPFMLESRFLNQTLYIRVPENDTLGFIVPKGAVPASDTWIALSHADGSASADSGFNFPSLFLSKANDVSKMLSSENIAKIKQIFSASGAFELNERTGVENIGGIDTEHYHFTVNKENLFTAIDKINTEVLGIPPDDQSNTLLHDRIDKTEIGGGNIWIGIADKLPYRLAFSIMSRNAPGTVAENSTEITLDLKDYNKDVAVDAPESPLSLTQFLGALESGKTTQNLRELLQAAPLTASVFERSNNGSYRGVCSSKKGFFDLMNDVAKSNGGVRPHCSSGTAGWILYLQSGPDKNNYVCLDATGANKETQGPIIGLTCPLN